MDWSIYEDADTGLFKPVRLSINKCAIKVKDVTELQWMRQDLKGLEMEEAKPVFMKLYNDSFAHELEVEDLESAFNRAPKSLLSGLHCFKGHFSALEELLDAENDNESMPLPLSESQTYKALSAGLIERCAPETQKEWEEYLYNAYKVSELKALMQERGIEPKGRKADLAAALAEEAIKAPNKMPPCHEFRKGENLLPELKALVLRMFVALAEQMIGYPYYYQRNVWHELVLDWPIHDWPWMKELIERAGGEPASSALNESLKPSSGLDNSSYDLDRQSSPKPSLELKIFSTDNVNRDAKTAPSDNTWSANDFEQPVEVIFYYQGERDRVPQERHVSICRVSVKSGRIFFKGMCLSSHGLKMFMLDRIQGDMTSLVTGELLSPHQFRSVDELRKALVSLGVRRHSQLSSAPPAEVLKDDSAPTITGESMKLKSVKRTGIIGRLLAKLGL